MISNIVSNCGRPNLFARNASAHAVDIVTKPHNPLTPSIRLNAFVTPAAMNRVMIIPTGANAKMKSKPGTPTECTDRLKKYAVKPPEHTIPSMRLRGEIANPKSSLKPTITIGKSDRKNLPPFVSMPKYWAKGYMLKNVRKMAKPPMRGTKPECADCTAMASFRLSIYRLKY